MKDGSAATAWPGHAGLPSLSGPRRGLSGIRRTVGPGLALIGLATTVLSTRHGVTAAHRTAALVDGIVIAVGFLAVIYTGPRARPAVRTAMLAGLYAAAVAHPVIIGDPRGLGMVSYPIIASAVLLPPLCTRLIGTGFAVLEVALSWWLLGAPAWDAALLIVFVAFVLTGISQLSRTVAELRAARDEIAELSAAAERDRVARDLHDVLGHSLTTIAVKTGLARRVMESGADPERAIAEIHDAERLSRDTLDEIRATVSGYRRASLTAELAGARSALRGAGIAAHLPGSADDVREDLREPFAHVLREGITNVIRHSGAATCEVRLTPTSIEIRDMGAPHARVPGGEMPATGAPEPGVGLAGLAERLAAAGARLEAGPQPGGGFRLTATAEEDTR